MYFNRHHHRTRTNAYTQTHNSLGLGTWVLAWPWTFLAGLVQPPQRVGKARMQAMQMQGPWGQERLEGNTVVQKAGKQPHMYQMTWVGFKPTTFALEDRSVTTMPKPLAHNNHCCHQLVIWSCELDNLVRQQQLTKAFISMVLPPQDI